MGFSPRAYLLERKTFCCCLPVRVGAVAMSFLTMLLSGAVSLYIWVEVAQSDSQSTTNPDAQLDPETRTAFIISGAVQSLLFVASILGFVGAIVRKQSFVQIYAWFIWIHLFLSLAAGSYFLWVITHTIGSVEMQCKQGFTGNGEDPNQLCNQVLSLAGGLLIGIIVLIWLVEIYGALIIARYSHQIVNEKLEIRRQLMEFSTAPYRSYRSPAAAGNRAPRVGTHYRDLSNASEANIGLLVPHANTPYRDSRISREQQPEPGLPAYTAESAGYGGGRPWSLQEASAEEKRLMREAGDIDGSQE